MGGLGHDTPRTTRGRAVSVLWMIIGVSVTARFIGVIVEILDEFSYEEFNEMQFMTEKIFRELDEDKSGKMSKNEFRIGLLLRHSLVGRDVLDAIDARFDAV